jgi:hypothetical protein
VTAMRVFASVEVIAAYRRLQNQWHLGKIVSRTD